MMNYKILIVDDQADNLEAIVGFLEQEDQPYRILQALSGEVALSIAKAERPNLIITDWEMPEMDGIQLIKQLKLQADLSQIPVIMCTGVMVSSSDLKTAIDAGAVDYIRKPIDRVELISRIKSMLLLADSHKENIDLKNKELASTAMNILKNNEFNQDLLKHLKKLNCTYGTKNKSLENELNELCNKVSSKIKGEAWEQFELYFKNVHPNFMVSLARQFPDLTPAELKLSALLRLNLSTKEIADITFNTPESVKTSRTRLRRKLKLDAGESIVAFLLGI